MTIRIWSLGAFAFTSFVVLQLISAHSHSHEAPHLKYGREVNEAAQRGEDTLGHHGHSHYHEEEEELFHHEHSHGHAHDADGGCPHAKAAAEKAAKLAAQKAKKVVDKTKEYVYDKNSYLAVLNDPKIRLWTYSIGATILISVCPFLILAFIPIKAHAEENSSLLKVLLALGAGGLLGDAFLHLIPHAQMAVGGGDSHGHTHSHSHSHAAGEHHEPHDMSVGGGVLAGFIVFFVAEKIVRLVRGEDSEHGHSHGVVVSSALKETKKPKRKPRKAKQSDDESASLVEEDDEDAKSTQSASSTRHSQRKMVEKAETEVSRLKVAAWLNMIADAMHNFTDGLAIGASFIAGTTVQWPACLCMRFRTKSEILLCWFNPAMFTQLLTALAALLGCIVSLWSVDAEALSETAQSSWVLPFTAGGFIYIAAVSVLPELLEKSSALLTVAQIAAMSVGVFCMYLIALYE
ncbi:Histidine-rich membrane protein KE4-like protein 2 [Aphelenchoides besseyi]|nr:Histidine-rich membrane protein KE4-like protein 2 [Aphelenchoides besseyi]